MNEVINAIKSRRSVRAYKSDALKKETIQAIVEAGCWAPTGCNTQAWHFSVVQDRALLEEVSEKTKKKMSETPVDFIKNLGCDPSYDVTYKAPVLIIVSMGSDQVSGEVDCTAAMQNMMLAAQSMEIASCWMGFVHFIFGDDDMMKRLGVPEGFKPQQAAVLGYRDGEKAAAPERRLDVVTYTGSF